MPPKSKPEAKQLTPRQEALQQAMKRMFWVESLCMALAATAETSRTAVDLPHVVSNLADLGAHLAGETLTLLANTAEGGAKDASEE